VGYRILIPLIIGLMAIHCFGDWLRKALQLRLRSRPEQAVPGWNGLAETVPQADRSSFRMFLAERMEHALLIAAFAVLVWSGFALKYPDEWWARPLAAWEGTLRGTVHRIAGAALIGVSVLHFVSLIVSPRLREHWKPLLPRRRDITEAFARFTYNLGFGKHPRRFRRIRTSRRLSTGPWFGAQC
jgi:hypothetical protein